MSHFLGEVLLDKSYLRSIFHLGSELCCNAGNILLFNENTLSNCRFVLSVTKSEELKCSSIVLLESILKQIDPVDIGHKLNVHKMFRKSSERLMYVQLTSCVYGGGYHLVSYSQFIALSQQQQEKIGEPWESGSQNKTVLTRAGITLPKSHSNAGIFPKICLFCCSA